MNASNINNDAGLSMMREVWGVNRMDESQKQPFQLSFNRFLWVRFQGSEVASNGGLIFVRELDERLGFGELIDEHLTDWEPTISGFLLRTCCGSWCTAAWRKIVLACTQVDISFQLWEGQNVNSG